MHRLRYAIAGHLVALAMRIMPRGEHILELKWKR